MVLSLVIAVVTLGLKLSFDMLPITFVFVVSVVCVMVVPCALMDRVSLVSAVTIGMIWVTLLVIGILVVLGWADLLLTLSTLVFVVSRLCLRVVLLVA